MSKRILVAIANHGTKNRTHCEHLINTYGAMQYEVDVVVLSDKPKDYGPDVDVLVGAPTSDPWSLPFAHRQLFIERQDDYDLFLYTEDDTEVLERHIDLFVEASRDLPVDTILGFLRYEYGQGEEVYYSTAHHVYHWDSDSVVEANDRIYARYTNDHAACYILSRQQLKRCIASGGYPSEPHKTHFDMLVSAATDPYTKCGLTKLIYISELFDYSLHHLPNAYVNKIGVTRADIEAQTTVLVDCFHRGEPTHQLFEPTTKIRNQDSTWDKSYYEALDPDVIDLMNGARSVLSVGCGRGATEHQLKSDGSTVSVIPIDSVIAACPARYGLETTTADLEIALDELADRRFEAVLFNRSLAYFADPAKVLRLVLPLLEPGGHVVVAYDNRQDIANLRSFRRKNRQRVRKGGFDATGVHWTDKTVVSGWLASAGLRVGSTIFRPPEQRLQMAARTAGVLDRWFGATALTTAVNPGEKRPNGKWPSTEEQPL